MSVDFESFRFASPVYLWLLIVPAVLMGVWGWRVVRRRASVRRLTAQRIVPVRQRFGPFGDLAFWACVLGGAQPIPVAVPASDDGDDKDLGKLVNAWPARRQTPHVRGC